ncbi:hypothetical protein D3C84_1103670 [compost metagenome]
MLPCRKQHIVQALLILLLIMVDMTLNNRREQPAVRLNDEGDRFLIALADMLCHVMFRYWHEFGPPPRLIIYNM